MKDFVKAFEFRNNAGEFSSLALAFIGDSVFDLFARTYVLSKGNYPVDKMNAAARRMVNAGSQSEMYHIIEDMLTEEEHGVLKRGRNANSHTMAKNQSVTDYRHATGLEALFGYLYLKGRTDRLNELFLKCIDELENRENGGQKK